MATARFACPTCERPVAMVVEPHDCPGHRAAADTVNHPPHYTAHPSGVECIELTEAMTFCYGNALKYLWRSGQKAGVSAIEDRRKAAWYLRREADACQRDGGDGTLTRGSLCQLAARVLAHEPPGPLADLLRLTADGWAGIHDLLVLADRIDPPKATRSPDGPGDQGKRPVYSAPKKGEW